MTKMYVTKLLKKRTQLVKQWQQENYQNHQIESELSDNKIALLYNAKEDDLDLLFGKTNQEDIRTKAHQDNISLLLSTKYIEDPKNISTSEESSIDEEVYIVELLTKRLKLLCKWMESNYEDEHTGVLLLNNEIALNENANARILNKIFNDDIKSKQHIINVILALMDEFPDDKEYQDTMQNLIDHINKL